MSKLICYGGAGTSTGANFLLELKDKKILIDCGMLQGSADAEVSNSKPFSYDPTTIDYLFITHAHIDHIGLVPKLVKDGFSKPIFSTPETKKIAEFLLLDAAKINREKEEPIYRENDVERALSLWQTLPYYEKKGFDGFSVELLNAGHILGSAMIKFETESGGKFVFTGDLGNSPSSILPDTDKILDADYLLMESVYGDRNHPGLEERDEKFLRVIKETIDTGGTLLLPAFSLERTQVLLFELDNLFEQKKLAPVPVFLDSPLAIKLTKIYENSEGLYNEEAEKEIRGGDDIFRFPSLKETMQVRDSKEIVNTAGAKIIIAGSGMSTAGRILSHEKKFLPDPKTTLLLVGYQGAGTLGRKLEEGEKEVMIDDTKVVVRARVEKIEGFSAHADSDALVNFVSNTKKSLKKVFVAMGEPQSAIFLAQRLRDELEVDAVVAETGKVYEIII